MEEYKKGILGVYVREAESTIGGGATTTTRDQKTYWFVTTKDEEDGKAFFVQPLNAYHVPAGEKTAISREDLLSGYTPDPRYFERSVLPAIQQVEENLAKAKKFLEKGKKAAAEAKLTEVLDVDETNFEGNMSMAKIQYEKDQFDKAREYLDNMFTYNPELNFAQRNEINKLGIDLRKQEKFKASIDYYHKALDLNQGDDHLHYNLARAYFDASQPDKAMEHLKECLKLNPGLEAAEQFVHYLEKKKGGAKNGAEKASAKAPDKEPQATPEPAAKTGSEPEADAGSEASA